MDQFVRIMSSKSVTASNSSGVISMPLESVIQPGRLRSCGGDAHVSAPLVDRDTTDSGLLRQIAVSFYRAGTLVHGTLRSMRLSRPVRTRPGPIS